MKHIFSRDLSEPEALPYVTQIWVSNQEEQEKAPSLVTNLLGKVVHLSYEPLTYQS